MALTEIEYGSLASSEVMNNNFNYLDNRISGVSENLISNLASVNSNIVSINNSLSSLSDETSSSIEELNSNLTAINTALEESALYVTSYMNGASWYKEYYSDPEKTNRIWLEQGGYVNFGSAQFATRTITYPVAFTEICNAMGILFGPGAADDSNQGVAGWSNTTLTYVHRGWATGVVWRACGK